MHSPVAKLKTIELQTLQGGVILIDISPNITCSFGDVVEEQLPKGHKCADYVFVNVRTKGRIPMKTAVQEVFDQEDKVVVLVKEKSNTWELR